MTTRTSTTITSATVSEVTTLVRSKTSEQLDKNMDKGNVQAYLSTVTSVKMNRPIFS
jgi:hypothetical protein